MLCDKIIMKKSFRCWVTFFSLADKWQIKPQKQTTMKLVKLAALALTLGFFASCNNEESTTTTKTDTTAQTAPQSADATQTTTSTTTTGDSASMNMNNTNAPMTGDSASMHSSTTTTTTDKH